MKNKSILILIIFTLFSAASCSNDPDPQPQDPAEQWLGTWTINETVTPADGSGSFTDNYQVVITRTALEGKLQISNFSNIGASVTATILPNSISIDVNPVTAPSGAQYIFNGSISTNNSISYTASTTSGQERWRASGTATKN